MSGEYKKCPNGHYYQGPTCPYCGGTSGNGTTPTQSTVVVPSSGDGTTTTKNGFGSGTGTTDTNNLGGGGNNTTIVGNGDTIVGGPGAKGNGYNPGTRTEFVDTDFEETSSGSIKEQKVYRNTRKLVGWLVTYSLDSMGVDFKLYEGRNIIGRDVNCNITINDSTVSSTHAVILFRSGKYSITDQQSSHGTFVNGEDIELEPRYLKDGDIIRLGKTILMVRFSLFDA
jgi:hypothetical protein